MKICKLSIIMKARNTQPTMISATGVGIPNILSRSINLRGIELNAEEGGKLPSEMAMARRRTVRTSSRQKVKGDDLLHGKPDGNLDILVQHAALPVGPGIRKMVFQPVDLG
jgi:hypothetical protein